MNELQLHGEPETITIEHVRTFTAATQAGDLPAYAGDTPAAPPLLPIRYFHPLFEALLKAPRFDVDYDQLVFAGQDLTLHEPLAVGDVVSAMARIGSVEQKRTGRLITLQQVLHGADDTLLAEATSTVFVRDPAPPAESAEPAEPADKPRKAPAVPPPEPTAPTFSSSVIVAPTQTRRFAAASTDHNPLHLDPRHARKVGLPDVILHGLCSMAFASNAVVEQVADGDPTRLLRIAVRFTRPVFLGDVLTTEGTTEPGEGVTVVRFVTRNQQGAEVLSGGLAEVAE